MAKAPFYGIGGYVGRVVRQSLGVSSGKSTPQLALTCVIVECVDDFGTTYPVEQSYERTIYIYFTNHETAKEIVLKQLAVLGYDKPSLKFLSPDQPGFVDFAGRVVPLYCKHEEYEGELRERWQISTPRELPENKPIEASALVKLDALYGKGLKELATKKTAPASPSESLQESIAEADGGDDIPF